MGFHHVALATHDTAATHAFYTDVMGFRLVKVVAAPTPGDQGGWAKHFFYSTGDEGATGGDGAPGADGDSGMIAFWEIHDPTIGEGYTVDINAVAGLPTWVNHIAFDAPTIKDLHRHRDRWRAHGHHVLEVDHEFCISVYIRDPSGNMVEFCHTTRAFTEAESAEAEVLLRTPLPALTNDATVTVHAPILVAGTVA